MWDWPLSSATAPLKRNRKCCSSSMVAPSRRGMTGSPPARRSGTRSAADPQRSAVGRAKTRRHLHRAAHARWQHLVEIDRPRAVRGPAASTGGGDRVVADQGQGRRPALATEFHGRCVELCHQLAHLGGLARRAQLGDFNGSTAATPAIRSPERVMARTLWLACRDMEAPR